MHFTQRLLLQKLCSLPSVNCAPVNFLHQQSELDWHAVSGPVSKFDATLWHPIDRATATRSKALVRGLVVSMLSTRNILQRSNAKVRGTLLLARPSRPQC